MIISLEKFGTMLISRPTGKEAFLILQPMLEELKKEDEIEIDFQNVEVLTPSWADEFITPLVEEYKDRITFLNTKNPSVVATLETLEKAKRAGVGNG